MLKWLVNTPLLAITQNGKCQMLNLEKFSFPQIWKDLLSLLSVEMKIVRGFADLLSLVCEILRNSQLNDHPISCTVIIREIEQAMKAR